MEPITIPHTSLAGSHRRRTPVGPSRPPVAAPALTVSWARHQDDMRAAQRLRYQVFADEMGAKLPQDRPHSLPGHDIDRFDDFCEHLLVRDPATQLVVGTYRLLTPSQARRAGGLYAEGEFDCSALASLRNDMVELGRSCVHRDHRSGAAILTLWGALAGFMQRNRLQSMVGCASLPLHHPGLTYGEGAARIWAQLPAGSHCAAPWRVRPLLALPLREAEIAAQPLPQVALPPLVHGYLRMGAKVLGAPAWDPDFQTADLPILLQIADLPARYKRLLGC